MHQPIEITEQPIREETRMQPLRTALIVSVLSAAVPVTVMAQAAQVDKVIDNDFFPENVWIGAEVHMISEGTGANFAVTMDGHFIAEADGTVKVEFQGRIREVHRRSTGPTRASSAA